MFHFKKYYIKQAEEKIFLTTEMNFYSSHKEVKQTHDTTCLHKNSCTQDNVLPFSELNQMLTLNCDIFNKRIFHSL